MEFRFNLNEIFKEPFVEIGNSLIPPGFTGDKRALWDTQSKITQIVNAMGEASAHAQGLSKPITTADRLRNSEHKLYLLLDQSANNGNGAVTGMLKTGEKGLYVFDREGQHYQVSPPCVLDFYVHESRQRAGYGKGLFEHMLQKQQIEPVKMAIDRPSDKLLGFLNKHYGLNTPVKQMNNFVVYDGFFPRSSENPRAIEVEKSYTPGKKQSANGLQHGIPSSPYGRYGAPRPPCSMGQIIHNDSAVIKRNQEPTGVSSEPITNAHGQQYMYNSNQTPAWLVTQSVPNMSYSYSQNQQCPNQLPNSPTHQYAPTLQYSQYQQLAQNQNAQYPPCSGDHAINQQAQQSVQQTQMSEASGVQYDQKQNAQYPPSSGDYAIEQQRQQLVQQNQVPVDLGVHQDNPNANQEFQQAYHNYAMAQGDATSQSYKDQDMPPAAGPTQGQNPDQIQHQQVVCNPNEVQEKEGYQNQDVVQGQPQMFTYQGQIYCYNPQTQQYHMIPNENQHNIINNVSQNKHVHYNQSPMQSGNQIYAQPSQRAPYGQEHYKEPLRPQNLDGTVRRVQQSVSMPVPVTRARGNQNVMVHGTASAPISYQRQQVINGDPHNPGIGQAFTTASAPQAVAQYENLVNPQNQGVGQPHYQENNQIQLINQIVNAPEPGDENGIVQQSANAAGMAYELENMAQAPQTMTQAPLMAQVPQTLTPAPKSQVNTPRNVNVQNAIAESPRVNQALNINQVPVQQGPVGPQILANAQNLNLQRHQQPNMTYSQMALHNQAVNINTHQTQSVQLQGDDQHSGLKQQVNLVPAVESTHSRIHNVASSQDNQNLERQNIQQITHRQNIHVQRQQSQHQVMNQHQHHPVGIRPQNVVNQRAGMNLIQNENIIAMEQQPMGERKKAPQNLTSSTKSSAEQERHIRGNEECDLSKGYPPQHHQTSVAARPPIIIRN